MSVTELRELKKGAGMVGLTLEQYHAMIERGILEEGAPIELLDGFLIHKDRAKMGDDPLTVGTEHTKVVQRLMRFLRDVERHGCHFRVQQPIALPPDGEPEPDGAIARGTEEDYDTPPGPPEITCVIEVSDSSLHRDRVTKLRIYAAAGIPQYIIVNLVERVVEVYEAPVTGKGNYGRTLRLAAGDRVAFNCGADQVVPVEASSLLPAI